MVAGTKGLVKVIEMKTQIRTSQESHGCAISTERSNAAVKQMPVAEFMGSSPS
jgi:hypothetical protein